MEPLEYLAERDHRDSDRFLKAQEQMFQFWRVQMEQMQAHEQRMWERSEIEIRSLRKRVDQLVDKLQRAKIPVQVAPPQAQQEFQFVKPPPTNGPTPSEFSPRRMKKPLDSATL